MKTWSMFSALLLAGLSAAAPVFAGGETARASVEQSPSLHRFGPFVALVFDATVRLDVKFANDRLILHLHHLQP